VPGNTKNNVSEGGTGFFYVLNVRRLRLTYGELWLQNCLCVDLLIRLCALQWAAVPERSRRESKCYSVIGWCVYLFICL